MRKIPCPECNGEGEVPLPSHLSKTLDMIPPRSSRTAVELHDAAPEIATTTFNARIEYLRDLGLLIRVRDGRSWSYSRVPEHAVPGNHKSK